jgi:putative membrane protein
VQGSVIALWLADRYRARGALAAAAVAFLSFGVEYLGVSTEVPFGSYLYTDQLGVKFGAVPLPIPFAWLVAVPGAIAIAHLFGVRRWMRVPVAALLAVVLDITIEPFAAHVAGYWQWLDGGVYYGVPLGNFLAWGATAFVLAAITLAVCTRWRPVSKRQVELPAVLFVLNLVQFVCVDVAYGYYGAAVFGVPVALVSGWCIFSVWAERGRRVRSLLEW